MKMNKVNEKDLKLVQGFKSFDVYMENGYGKMFFK